MNQIETEYKLEVTADEFAACSNYLQEANLLRKEHLIWRIIFSISKNLMRKGGTSCAFVCMTDQHTNVQKKIWKYSASGERVREELREKVPKRIRVADKGISTVASFKDRTDYAGVALDYPAVYSLDVVVFPDETRYFVECEIHVPEEISSSIRPYLKESMLQTLHLSDRQEGIGMMRLVLSKSQKGTDG